MPISAAFIVAVTKNSTRGQHFFMFRFHLFLFLDIVIYFGVELISDIVFVSGQGHIKILAVEYKQFNRANNDVSC